MESSFGENASSVAKSLFYGCEHKWVFVTKFNTFEDSRANRPLKTTSIHRCSECMKIKKDVFK